MADLERCVFCGCAAGSFRSTSPVADKLRSWEPALFIHFIGTVCFCLFALPPARPITNANIVAQGTSTTIDLGGGGVYTYLFAKYDGKNDNSQVWYVGDLSGIITIPEYGPRNHGLSGWILFGPSTPGVPDGGTTVMLLGAALGALGIARRYIMS